MSTQDTPPAAHPAAAGPVRTHVPGNLVPKLVYLAFAAIVTLIGFAYVWEPVARMLNGEVVEARVSEIRVIEPGKPDVVYKYRRDYPEERNLEISFQHYVSVEVDGHAELFRLSADSRKTPIRFYNVNDRVKVAYYPHDPKKVAFAIEHARTWGAAGVICGVGLAMLVTAIPLVLTARKPIVIDPEAPAPPSQPETS